MIEFEAKCFSVNMRRFSKVSERLLTDSTFLYLEKPLSISADTMGGYLMYAKSLAVSSSSILKVLKDSPVRIREMLHYVS
jgi:hypothetical protein